MSRTMMLLIAMGLSVVTALLLWSYTEEQKKKLLRQYQTVEVVVAARDIPPRTRISADLLATEVVPVQFIQPGAVLTMDEVVGKISLVPIKKGSQILSDLVVSPEQLGGLSAVLMRGTRAVTIRVDAVRGVGGMIQPGDFVDVFAVLPDQQNPERSWVVVPFQNLQVVAVGGRLRIATAAEFQQGMMRPEAAGAVGTITLMVDPQTARDLLALNESAITILSLRPVGDMDSIYLDPVRVQDIIAKYKPKQKYLPAPKPREREVELYVGVDRKRYKVVGNQVILAAEEKGFRPPEPAVGGAPPVPPVPNFAQIAQQVLSQLPGLMGP